MFPKCFASPLRRVEKKKSIPMLRVYLDNDHDSYYAVNSSASQKNVLLQVGTSQGDQARVSLTRKEAIRLGIEILTLALDLKD